MKKTLPYFISLLVLTCNNDNAFDCLQTNGNITVQDYTIDSFNQIIVNENIELVVIDGEDYSLKIETGINLISDISFTLSQGILTLNDNNSCNLLRAYAPTRITVTTPTLKKIISNTQYVISSQGILSYPNLELVSDNFSEGLISVGDFNLEVESQTLNIISNNLSQFFISGSTENLFIGFYSGTTSFFGANLIAQEVNVFHRSSHNIIIHPVHSLSGELLGTGDLISMNTPDIIDITELYIGSLVFLD